MYEVQSEELVISFKRAGELSGSPVPASRIPVLFIHDGHALSGGSQVGNVELWDLRMGKMHSLILTSECSCTSCVEVVALSVHV